MPSKEQAGGMVGREIACRSGTHWELMRTVLSVKVNGCKMEGLTLSKLCELMTAEQRDRLQIDVKAIRGLVRCVSWQMVLMVEEMMKRQTTLWSDA